MKNVENNPESGVVIKPSHLASVTPGLKSRIRRASRLIEAAAKLRKDSSQGGTCEITPGDGFGVIYDRLGVTSEEVDEYQGDRGSVVLEGSLLSGEPLLLESGDSVASEAVPILV